MVGSCICGSNSLPREEECEFNASLTPRKSSSSRSKDTKNPYSGRGLKRFCALLEKTEEMRQKIYSELGTEAISLVRFAYSNGNNCKPIVVRIKGMKGRESPSSGQQHKSGPIIVTAPAIRKEIDEGRRLDLSSRIAEEERFLRELKLKLQRMRLQPSDYLPVSVMLTLLLLALLGRSAAILCISLGWYLMSLMADQSTDLRRSIKKKKDNGKRWGEMKMSGRRLTSFKSNTKGKATPHDSRGMCLVGSQVGSNA
ncbi:hypothetical protein Nepgr_019822 [Nepenthes gracilis]|uniref:Uncharacterized protein n=1 Tax=Nepenthes gracilis TaxID=150966 RepID=A0AAD3SVZ5_NEPGR|nr:hypothetical protein Nepgr_019822 [Nepenthes gracilis]